VLATVPARALPAFPDVERSIGVIVVGASFMLYGLITILSFPRL
jgi:hypothetical protein